MYAVKFLHKESQVLRVKVALQAVLFQHP